MTVWQIVTLTLTLDSKNRILKKKIEKKIKNEKENKEKPSSLFSNLTSVMIDSLCLQHDLSMIYRIEGLFFMMQWLAVLWLVLVTILYSKHCYLIVFIYSRRYCPIFLCFTNWLNPHLLLKSLSKLQPKPSLRS